MFNAKVTGVGHYIPHRRVNNEEVAGRYGISVEFIDSKETGIQIRHYVDDETTTDIVAKAIDNLLEKGLVAVEDIGCIIVGTLTPDNFFPSTAVGAINRVGAVNAWGFDLSAACSGFSYGFSIATSMIQQGTTRNVIVCGADRMSKTINNFDYKTGVLFGDGAGAVLIEATNETRFVVKGSLNQVIADNLNDVFYKTPFSASNWPSEKFELQGGNVYRSGVAHTANAIQKYLKSKTLTLDNFEHIIPHQSNLSMIRDIAELIGPGSLEKFRINIDRVGNTGGASIAICLSEFVQNGTIKRGDRILMAGFGAGYTISINDLVWGG